MWAIKKEWKAREKKGHFAAIDRLVWTFLRLGQTSKSCFCVPEASFSEAASIIVGDTPIKTKALDAKQPGPLHGEKALDKLYKQYKSVCHFIAVLEYCKKEIPNWEYLFINSVYSPLVFTEKFLKIAHWFRKNLLLLEKPNVKSKVLNLSGLSGRPPGHLDEKKVENNLRKGGDKSDRFKIDANMPPNEGGLLPALSAPFKGPFVETSCYSLDATSLLNEYEERLAIVEYDGHQTSPQAERIAYLDAFMAVLATLPYEDVQGNWLSHKIKAA